MSLLSQFYPQGSAASGFIDVMVIMAGGGGGVAYSNVGGGSPNGSFMGAGGGGDLFTGTISIKPGSTCPITIGAGGAEGVGPANPEASPGGQTFIQTPVGTYVCQGGGAGGGYLADGAPGGSGGGGGANGPGNSIGGTKVPSFISGRFGESIGNPGGSTNFSGPASSKGGGGGGAGGSGAEGTPGNGGKGGPGVGIVGAGNAATAVLCAGGSSANADMTIANAAANTGNGASGQPTVVSAGNNGGSGIMYIQYPTQFAASPSFPGATDLSPSTPGFRTYRFTASGSITLP